MSTLTVEKINTLTGHRDCVYTLAPWTSPDRFFSASGDGMIVLWDLNSPDEGQLIARLPNSVYALSYHPGLGLLIAGHNYEGIHFLNVENKREEGSLQLTKAAIFALHPFGKYLFVGTGEGELLKVDVEARMVVGRVKGAEKSLRSITMNIERGEIAAGYSDHRVRLFDLDLKLKSTIEAHSNSVFIVKYTPDGRHLVTGSRDARLKFWDISEGYGLSTEIVAHMYAINDLDFSPDGKHFVTCSLDKTVKVWDTAERKLLKVVDRARHGGHTTSVNKVLWTSHHDQILSASDDRTISVWHMIF